MWIVLNSDNTGPHITVQIVVRVPYRFPPFGNSNLGQLSHVQTAKVVGVFYTDESQAPYKI